MIGSGLLVTDARGALRLTLGILSSAAVAGRLAKNEANIRRLFRQVAALL